MISLGWWCAVTVALGTAASAESIAQINGIRYLSPYNGKDVTNVTGIVTAKSSSGIYIRGLKRTCDKRYSNSLYLFGSALGKNASIELGDVITVNGRVSEYRSDPTYVYLTELTGAKIVSSTKGGPQAKPRVIGKDTSSPPTEQFSSLDGGDIFAVPNNQSLISVSNPTLQPDKFGMDFWESLSGELVTVTAPVAIAKPNSFGETWVVGDWKTTGKNGRGGLTLSDRGTRLALSPAHGLWFAKPSSHLLLEVSSTYLGRLRDAILLVQVIY